MSIAGTIIQFFFVAVFLLLACFYFMIYLSAKRAIRQSKIPAPLFIKTVMILIGLLLLGSLMFVLFFRPY